jgi:hypothetical protein
MQFKTIAISTFIGLAAATSSTDVSALTNELPSCSLLCLVSGASTAGCEATDYACQCENQAAITTASTSCLKSACSASEIGSKLIPCLPWPRSQTLTSSSSHQKRDNQNLQCPYGQQRFNPDCFQLYHDEQLRFVRHFLPGHFLFCYV